MNLKVSGIVLKVNKSGDSDRYCTILTDTHGVISAFAKGANNLKNKNSTATAQFVYGSYELFRRRDHYIIDESQYEELYTGLREDIFRLSVAQYLCQLAMELVPAGQPSEDYLWLMRAALRKCGVYENDLMYFIPATSEISCGKCGLRAGEHAVRLSRGAMTALRHSIYADIKKLFAFSLNDESMKQFSEAADAFTTSRIEKSLTALEFLKTMM